MIVRLAYLFPLCCGILTSLYGQTDSSWQKAPELHFSGAMDAYYCYDFNRPMTPERQPFFFNQNRHNQFAVNMALVQLEVKHSRYRSTIGFHAGTYAMDNYAAEPVVLRHIYQANIGLALTRKGKLWLDMGIFGSHIGFESAIGADNWTLTRSLLAENSPYYLAGGKLIYQPTEKWEFSALICNGWQRIRRVQGNSMPSFGSQVKYTPSKRFSLNWSTFAGTDMPDSTRTMRYFNNLYAQFEPSKRFGLIAGVDFGAEQTAIHASNYSYWYSIIAIGRCAIASNWGVALRAEYYDDADAVVTSTAVGGKGLTTFGASLNVDYTPVELCMVRLEIRHLQSPDKLFRTNDNLTDQNTFVTFGMHVRIE